MTTIEGREFQYFYRVLFSDRVACVVLGALGTLVGRFDYWQREFAFGWGDNRWNRHTICHHWRDVLRHLRRDDCNALNLGGCFSTLRVMQTDGKTLTPYDLAIALPTGAVLAGGVARPRDWERKLIHDSCGTPAGGELVIDVDLDDQLDGLYNRHGICACAGRKRTVCATCWHVFMDPAQMAIELLLAHYNITRYVAYFSGRRGVHFMLLEPWIIGMTNGERACFMDAISRPPTEHSELGRAIYGLLAPIVDAHHVLRARCPALSYAAVMRELYPKMDIPVGADATHLHGVPLTLHPDTRVLRIPIGSASNPRTRFSYERHRYDVDRLTRDPNNIMWACALRLLSVLLGPKASMSPQEWVQAALAEGGHTTTKSEALN